MFLLIRLCRVLLGNGLPGHEIATNARDNGNDKNQGEGHAFLNANDTHLSIRLATVFGNNFNGLDPIRAKRCEDGVTRRSFHLLCVANSVRSLIDILVLHAT